LTAVVLYVFGILLMWRVAWKLTRNDFVALASACLYALHPLHAEGVSWLSGASVELVMSALFFGGFLAYLCWRETGQSHWLAVSAAVTLAALLSKEPAAALPVLIVAHAWLFPVFGS